MRFLFPVRVGGSLAHRAGTLGKGLRQGELAPLPAGGRSSLQVGTARPLAEATRRPETPRRLGPPPPTRSRVVWEAAEGVKGRGEGQERVRTARGREQSGKLGDFITQTRWQVSSAPGLRSCERTPGSRGQREAGPHPRQLSFLFLIHAPGLTCVVSAPSSKGPSGFLTTAGPWPSPPTCPLTCTFG